MGPVPHWHRKTHAKLAKITHRGRLFREVTISSLIKVKIVKNILLGYIWILFLVPLWGSLGIRPPMEEEKEGEKETEVTLPSKGPQPPKRESYRREERSYSRKSGMSPLKSIFERKKK